MLRHIVYLFIFSCLPVSNKSEIHSDNVAQAIGPYSHAILIDNHLYLSGQIALTANNQILIDSSIEGQSKQVFENITNILAAADFKLADIVQVTVYLANLNDYKKFNEIYMNYFEKPYPARAVVEVARIPKDALLEISVIAVK
jgi:2-iminobutanoate/2-iminopropanoate deaminase